MKKIISLLTVGILSVSLLVGCGAKEDSKVIIGATSVPHAQILEQIVDDLKAKGIELEVKEFNDYQQLNPALSSGDITANFFQHQPFLDKYNQEKNDNLVSIAAIHYEPYGIYPGKTKSLDELKDGAEIAIPNDPTNGGRALLLLQQEGLIKLKDDAGIDASVFDIVDNPRGFKIIEIAAAQLPRSLQDVDVAVINGNYALEAGYRVKDALAVESADSLAAETYGNIIAVREKDKDNQTLKTVIEVLKSEKVKKYIEETFEGDVIPLF
jgi:D-methionine transport system substrate-binding protein